jgi:hypothetical protein
VQATEMFLGLFFFYGRFNSVQFMSDVRLNNACRIEDPSRSLGSITIDHPEDVRYF